MKSVYEIYMDFEHAMDQVQKLRTISKNVDTIGNEGIGGAIKTIKSNWTGENSDDYIEKSLRVEGKVKKTGADIGLVADRIETMAIRTRDAELRALEIANN